MNIIPKLEGLNAVEMANFGWAYAKMGFPHPQLFAAMATLVQRCADDFLPPQIGLILFAYATLGCSTEEERDMIEVLARKVLPQIEDATANDLNSIVKAVCLGGFADNVFLRCLAPRMQRLAVQSHQLHSWLV